jgi:hypothetical protein
VFTILGFTGVIMVGPGHASDAADEEIGFAGIAPGI